MNTELLKVAAEAHSASHIGKSAFIAGAEWQEKTEKKLFADLLKVLKNILLDAEVLKGGELVSIPAIDLKLIKDAIAKAKLI